MILKKDVTPTVKRAIDDLNLGGVVYGELSSQRIYANGTQLGALLGGVDDSGKGVAGVESMENSALTGTDGYVIYQQGNGGEEIPGTLTGSQEAVNGSDVALTLDHDVDWYVKQALLEGQKKTKATWAMAVVQDIQTGEILALEDTDEYQAGSDQAKLNASRAVSESFEPGSVGKVITMSGLLQTGLHKATDKFTVPYSYTKDGQEYHDSSAHGDEHWTLAGIIKNSSNVGVVMASSQYTKKQRYEYSRSSASASPAACPSRASRAAARHAGIVGRANRQHDPVRSGILRERAPADQRRRDHRQQGRAQAAVADQVGHPRRRHGGDAAGGLFHARHRRVGRRPGQERHGSVAEGYSKVVNVKGYRIAAKTGTAEVAGSDGRLTSIVADFAGMIPADNPRFAITVIMKDPQGTYGGMTAGPVFAKIGEFLMQKYNVPTSSPRNDAIAVDW